MIDPRHAMFDRRYLDESQSLSKYWEQIETVKFVTLLEAWTQMCWIKKTFVFVF